MSLRVILCVALIAVGTGSAASGPEPQRLGTAPVEITTASGATVSLVAELAVTDEERAVGLMHRTRLQDGEGMLFFFARDTRLSFWMKNTLIPLSIAFIASDGTISEIRDMRPLDLTPVVSERSVRYALEVPQGWFDRVGVRPGDAAVIPNVANRPLID